MAVANLLARPSGLGLSALSVAQNELGFGESGGNNRGPHVERYRRGIGGRGSWCAHFVLYCFEEAADGELPFNKYRRGKRIGGAKLLTRRILDSGIRIDPGDDPKPGDVICWHRPKNGKISWQGHVGIVEHYDPLTDNLVTVEGNKGRFPALVKQEYYPGGEWRRLLYRIARVRG